MSGWYGVSVGALKVMGALAAAAAAGKGIVAFGAWRTNFRNRLVGGEPHGGKTS